MRKNSRAYNILKVGMEAIGEEEPSDILLAIAAMIDYATRPKTKKKPPPLLYTEKDIIAALDVQLHVARWGSLNRSLRSVTQRDDDIPIFSAWFHEDMLPWLESKNIPFTFSMLARKYPEWLEKAKASDPQPRERQENKWR